MLHTPQFNSIALRRLPPNTQLEYFLTLIDWRDYFDPAHGIFPA